METETIVIGVLVLVLLWLLHRCMSVAVNRFYSPGCGYCVSTQAEWDAFKQSAWMKMVRCNDINVDLPENAKLKENFEVKSWPCVIAVTPCGMRFKYEGERTAAGYSAWVEGLAK